MPNQIQYNPQRTSSSNWRRNRLCGPSSWYNPYSKSIEPSTNRQVDRAEYTRFTNDFDRSNSSSPKFTKVGTGRLQSTTDSLSSLSRSIRDLYCSLLSRVVGSENYNFKIAQKIIA